MPLQSAKNVKVAFFVETDYNTPPGAAVDAEYLRFTPSAGLSKKAANIKSNEQRPDGLSTMGRNGSETVDGSYGAEMSLRSHDTIYEALQRSTWEAPLVITQATSGAPASITTTANRIIGADGTFYGAIGLRKGDVFRLNLQDADNYKNLRVRAFENAGKDIVVWETLEVVAGADTSYSITRGKKLKNPSTPTKRTFGVEQNYTDILGSKYFGGVRWISMKINGTPDGMATVEFGALGASMITLEDPDAPYFTDAIAYNSVPLVFADAKINNGAGDMVIATAFELTYTINAALEPVVGTKTSPDVFDNDASLSGSFTALMENFDNAAAFSNETEFELSVLLTEPRVEPKPYLALWVPRCKYSDANAPLGGDGGLKESLPFTCGAQEEDLALGHDATLMTMITSAAA